MHSHHTYCINLKVRFPFNFEDLYVVLALFSNSDKLSSPYPICYRICFDSFVAEKTVETFMMIRYRIHTLHKVIDILTIDIQ